MTFRFVLLLTCVAVCCCCSKPIDERIEKIGQEVDLLQINFVDSEDRFLLHTQAVANEMIKEGESEGYVMKKISGLFADILATNYAISLKALEVSREVLKRYFNESITQESKSVTIDDAELLEQRISIRAQISAFYYNTQKWKLLHKLIYHYVIQRGRFRDEPPLLKETAYLTYWTREELVNEVAETDEAIRREFEKREGVANDKQSIIENLDRMIEEVLDVESGSENSGQIQVREKPIRAKLLFATIKDVERLKEENVDPKLLEQIRQSDEMTREHVISYSPEELDKVTEKDIKNGKIMLPSFGNRQTVYNQY